MSDVIDYFAARKDLAARDVDILGRTLWGEARGEGQAGMEAVAAVVINRVAHARSRSNGNFWWGNSITRVCQKPFQFSCWNRGDPNLSKMMALDDSDRHFAMALRIARWAVSGNLPDPTGGADHYHAVYITPKWAMGRLPTAVIGRHVFYKLEGDK